jgi:hypothetical protein
MNELTKMNFGFQPLYRLRWRFDFVDKPSKFGVWNGASNLQSDSAMMVNKTGLLRACIEGEKIGEWVVKVLFEMEGHNYVTAQWIRLANAGIMVNKDVQTASLPSSLIGLSLLSSDKKYIVYVDGTGAIVHLPKTRMDIKLLEHSAGV